MPPRAAVHVCPSVARGSCKVLAITAVALATPRKNHALGRNTYLTIRATLATATMAITMMVMMMAIFPFQQASALSTKIAMYNLHNLTQPEALSRSDASQQALPCTPDQRPSHGQMHRRLARLQKC